MWEEFLDWAEVYRKPFMQDITFNKYKNTAQTIQKNFEDRPSSEIKRRDLQKFFNKLSTEYQKRTIKTIYQQILAFYQNLVDEGEISRNLMNGIRYSGIEKQGKRKFMEVDEVEKMLAALDLYDAKDVMIFTALKTGMRHAEVLGVTPDDLYKENGMYMLSINKTLDYKYSTGFKGTKTKTSVRNISITPETYKALKRFADSHSILHDESILGRIVSSTINRHLEDLCEEIDIPPISFHGLRHTHGSLLIREGVPVISVSKRLGHADTVITQRIYIHLLEDQKQEDDQNIVKIMEAI